MVIRGILDYRNIRNSIRVFNRNQLFAKLISSCKQYLPFYGAARTVFKCLFNPVQTLRVVCYQPQSDVRANKRLVSEVLDGTALDFDGLAELVQFDENCPVSSWHWIAIPALIQRFLSNNDDGRPCQILEIGTFNGRFSEMLVNNFNCVIDTVDLPDESDAFINSYSRDDELRRRDFIRSRNRRLENTNICFHQFDSIELISRFESESFDIIWVDGDHLAPQVYFDLLSALRLCRPNGFLCCDDVMTHRYKDGYVSDESFACLSFLESKGLIDLGLLLKRCKRGNANPSRKKFISVSRKI